MDYVSKTTRAKVAAAAHYRCEYCQTAQEISGAPMNIEFIVPARRHWVEAGWHPPQL